jgi:hypothetical protein
LGANLYTYALNNPIVVNFGNEYLTQVLGHSSSAYLLSINNRNPIAVSGENTSATISLVTNNSNFKIFAAHFRKSTGWESNPKMISGFLGRIGYSTYTTHTDGDSGLFYAFAGVTTEVTNFFGSTYSAGVGINAWDIVGLEVQVQAVGVGASLSVWEFGLSIDVNATGATSITLSRTQEISSGVTETSGVTASINTYVLVYTVYFVWKLYTTGDASWELQPQS